MPKRSRQKTTQPADPVHWLTVAELGELRKHIEVAKIISEADWGKLIREQGFTTTLHALKQIEKGKRPQSRVATVVGGVLETFPSGHVDAALDTDDGRIVISGERTDRSSNDPQLISADSQICEVDEDDALDAEQLLSQFTATGTDATSDLICMAEVTRFDAEQNGTLLPLLWQYVDHHRTSQNRDILTAVGAAIRKYIAIMPMSQMNSLALLLTPGNHEPLPLELELEVTKMIYRNFEVHPSLELDPEPELGTRLWEMAQIYSNPRILLRDKHSAVASLAIEALVAMRSANAANALGLANNCTYRWFAEMISDDLDVLRGRWLSRSEPAVRWLDQLRGYPAHNG